MAGSEKTELVCFPNPAVDILYINASDAYQADVYSITGSLVLSSNILASGQINVQDLAPGFYQVVIKTPNKTLSTSIIKK